MAMFYRLQVASSRKRNDIVDMFLAGQYTQICRLETYSKVFPARVSAMTLLPILRHCKGSIFSPVNLLAI
jgi:hypothetical protein